MLKMMPQQHKCTLELGSLSMIPKSDNGKGECYRKMRKSAQVTAYHPDTFEVFRSAPSLVAERLKQLVEGGRRLVHPLSLFSLYWNSFMVLINLCHIFVSSFRLCFICPNAEVKVYGWDIAMLILHLICLVDIIVNFNMGFVKKPSVVIMDRRSIAFRYLPRLFIPDLVSSLPIAFVILCMRYDNKILLLISHSLPILRGFRIFSIYKNLHTFIRIFTRSYICERLIHHSVTFAILFHWSVCILYVPAVIWAYSAGGKYQYVQFLNHSHIELCDFDMSTRYMEGFFVSISVFCSTGYFMYPIYSTSEAIMNSVLIICCTSFMIYSTAFLLKIYMIKCSSKMRFYELMDEVEKYMRHKEFPSQLRKRVLVFYTYRYQQLYFKEDTVLDSLSDQLRAEVCLHTIHKLISNASLFESMNANLVGTLLGCLKPEVYLPNDLVVCGGEVGDCMYFIAYGTVAVYSLKGAEVCHLEDGAYFGEVALLMKDSKRVATVVAIEITQVYRLDAADFRRYIVPDKIIYERVESLAGKRMHETVLLDDAFRNRDQSIHDKNVTSPATSAFK